jgi:urease beta subunit
MPVPGNASRSTNSCNVESTRSRPIVMGSVTH